MQKDLATLSGQIDAAISRAGMPLENQLALDLVERHGLGLRYVAPWRWLEWTGERWECRLHGRDFWHEKIFGGPVTRVWAAGTAGSGSSKGGIA